MCGVSENVVVIIAYFLMLKNGGVATRDSQAACGNSVRITQGISFVAVMGALSVKACTGRCWLYVG